jgi:hypothetical protein
MNFDPTSRYYGPFIITPEDYKKLKQDTSFLKLLSAISFENSAVQNRGQRAENSMKSLLNFLERELKNK